MQKKRAWRYKCDFCKKANCSSYHMARHEIGCTNNPNRECGVCKVIEKNQMADRPPMPLSEAKNLLPLLPSDEAAADELHDMAWEGNGTGSKAAQYLETLRKAVNYCPACTLAALRQSPTNSVAHYLHFDYKTASKEFWQGINDDAIE